MKYSSHLLRFSQCLHEVECSKTLHNKNFIASTVNKFQYNIFTTVSVKQPDKKQLEILLRLFPSIDIGRYYLTNQQLH